MNQPPELMTVEAARNWVESERESCAKIADDFASQMMHLRTLHPGAGHICARIAEAIRARVTP